jgi:hypothetical protein
MSTDLFLEKNDKNMLIVIAVVIFVLLSDTMINQVADFLAPQLVSNFGVALFVVFAIIFGVTQYVILRYTMRKIAFMYSRSKSTRIIHKMVSSIQYILLIVVLILVAQILVTSSYSTYILVALTLVSGLLSIALMAYFAKKFFSWYLSSKYSLLVVLYGLAFAIIALTFSDALIVDIYNLSTKSTVVYPTSEVVFPSYDEGTPIYLFRAVYDYVDLFSFIILWGATVLLLHEYIRKWKMRHWILVCVPLIYYLSTFVDYFGIYTPSSDSEWFSYYLYSSLNSTAGGLLFGFAFLIVARNIRNEMIRGHMIISSFGFILMFISNQVTLVATSYPPFGAVTLCYLGLSSYMILVGLYASAISVSQDATIRKSIRKSVINKSKLLGIIGDAEMQNEIEKWVKNLSAVNYKTNISTSMTVEDVKLYIQEVVGEVRKGTDRT